MNASVVVEAIVLKSYPAKDYDTIYTLFSRELGRVKVLAKGVKRAKSTRNPLMQTGNTVKVQLYEGHDLYILREVMLVQEAFSVTASPLLASYLLHVVELVDVLLGEGQVHVDIYTLARMVIAQLVYQPRQVYLRYFEVQLLQRLGYLPSGNSMLFDSMEERPRGMLQILSQAHFDDLEGCALSQGEHQDLVDYLHASLERVMERPLKSLAFFAS